MADLLSIPLGLPAPAEPPSENLRKYLTTNPVARVLIRRFLSTVGALALLARPSRVLEVGCGEGFVLRALGQALPEASTHGCDLSFSALRVARLINSHTPLFAADLHRLPLKPPPYDLVVCCEVLEHLPDPRVGLTALLGATERYVMLSVPEEPFFTMANLLRGRAPRRLGHVRGWTRSGFLRFARAHMRVVVHRAPFPWIVVLGERMS